MFNYDEANIVCDNFKTFLQHGLQIEMGYDEIKDVDSFEDMLRDNDGVLGFVKKICERTSFNIKCGFGYEDSNIFGQAGYPWTVNVRNILVGYHGNKCEFSDVQRYFELMNQHLPELDEAIAAKNENICGSEKFNLACKDYFEGIEKILSGILRNNKIEHWEMTPATYRDQKVGATFDFTEMVTYAQKRKILSVLDYALAGKYKAIMPGIKSINQVSGLYLMFKDSGKKAASCKSFVMSVKPNNWGAIAMDESAQFMPRIGMKRHQSI